MRAGSESRVAPYDEILHVPITKIGEGGHIQLSGVDPILAIRPAVHKRREEETEAQIRRLALQLFPRGGLQERSFNIVYYWARYGPDFLAQLSDGFPVGMRGHLVRDF